MRAFGEAMGMKVADMFYAQGESPDTVEKDEKLTSQLK